MTKSGNNGNSNISVSAEFVYNAQPVEQSNPPTTYVFSNANTTTAPDRNNTRNAQEKLLMGDQINVCNLPQDDFVVVKFAPPKSKPENESKLPNSCFKVFALGVINNLIEMTKCFGAKR